VKIVAYVFHFGADEVEGMDRVKLDRWLRRAKTIIEAKGGF
jgi:hypothetical protein